MGVRLDNRSDDKESTSMIESSSSSVADQSLDQSRRRFTRNAAVGGTVLLSLANRAAWGQDVPPECLSTDHWASYVDQGGAAVASATPGTADKAEAARLIESADCQDYESFPGNVCPAYGDDCIQGFAPSSQSRSMRQRDMMKDKKEK